MKKVITFLFCSAVLSSAFAQTGRHGWDDRNANNNSYGNATVDHGYQNDHDRDRDKRRYSIFQRDMQIQRVSRQYDYQIEQISCDRSLSRREKKFAIRALQAQKAEKINRIYLEYNGRGYTYNKNNGYGKYNR